MDIHKEIGEPAYLEPYQHDLGDAAGAVCFGLFFGLFVVGFKRRSYLHPSGYVSWQAGPGWEIFSWLAKKLPPEEEIRTGWEPPRPPEPPDPEPLSTRRADGMTTTGWDDPNRKELS